MPKRTKKPPTEAAITRISTENATRWVHEPSKPPHLEILPAGIDIVRDMTREGHNRVSIARTLRMSKSTFNECVKRQPEVEQALEEGRAALDHEVHDLLLQQGRAGYAPALMFLAKCRLGWRETDAPESRPNIQIIKLPDSRSPEDYMRALLTDGAEVKVK